MDGINTLFSREDMTFEGTIKYFKNHVPVTASIFYSITEEYRVFVSTVSDCMGAQILWRFYEEILAALEDRNTFPELRSNMNDFLESEGYMGLDPL